MKVILMTLLLAAAVVSVPPGAAHALNNKVVASYESGSGSSSWERGKWDSYVLSYTRFFSPLASEEEPYGAREFLQHPPRVDLSVRISSHDRYMDDVNIVPLYISYMKHEATVYTLSGMSYMGYGDRTGLGLRLEYRDNETKGTYNSTLREKALALRVHQYLTDRFRVGFDFEKRDSDASWGKRRNIYKVDAVALIDFYRVAGWYRNIGSNIEELGVGFGAYPYRDLGVFASYEVVYRTRDFSSTLSLRGEYYISRSTSLEMEYKWIEEDSGYSLADAVMLRLGQLF